MKIDFIRRSLKLLTLKKEQSFKLKASIVFIWLVAIAIILNAIYDSYLMYTEQYTYNEFAFYAPYANYFFMGFGLLVALGLLFRSKVARGIVVFMNYFSIVSLLYVPLIYGTFRGMPWYFFVGSLSMYVLIIYLLSHKEIVKVFGVNHLKREVGIYLVLNVVLLAVILWTIKSATSEFSDLELNLSSERVELKL